MCLLENLEQILGENYETITGGFQLLDLIIPELKSHMTC